MRKLKSFTALFLIILLSVSLVGCGDTKKSDSTQQADTSSQALKIIATSADYKPLFDKFTSETGIKTEFLSMSSGEVISRIKAEGGKPMADVWFGGGIDAFMQAKDEGLLEKVDFPAAKDISPDYKDKEGYWYTKGVTVVGFLVNKDILKDKNLPEPKTWKDLTNPIYKGEILMSNPAISGTNYGVVNGILQTKGDVEGWKYFEALNKNITYYSKRGGDPGTKTIAGEVAIGIVPADKKMEQLEKEKNVKLIYPEDGIPWVPEGVAAFKNSQNTAGAKKFIEWIYQDENLKEIAKIDKKDTVKIVKPNLQGVELTFPTENLFKQDVSLFGKNRTTILEKWAQMVGDKNEK